MCLGYEEAVGYISKKEEILKNTAVLREKIGDCSEIDEIEEGLK